MKPNNSQYIVPLKQKQLKFRHISFGEEVILWNEEVEAVSSPSFSKQPETHSFETQPQKTVLEHLQSPGLLKALRLLGGFSDYLSR